MDYRKLSLEELVVYVNQKLLEGVSLNQLDKKFGVSKSYTSNRIKRSKLYYKDPVINQYVLLDSNILENKNSYDITTGDDRTPREQENSILKKVSPRESNEEEVLTKDELRLVREILYDYKTKKIISSEKTLHFKEQVANRNIRVYTEQYNSFAKWCKSNSISQADALYKAIDQLMNGIE